LKGWLKTNSGKFDLDLFTKELFAVVLTSIPKEMTKESRGTAIFTPFQRKPACKKLTAKKLLKNLLR